MLNIFALVYNNAFYAHILAPKRATLPTTAEKNCLCKNSTARVRDSGLFILRDFCTQRLQTALSINGTQKNPFRTFSFMVLATMNETCPADDGVMYLSSGKAHKTLSLLTNAPVGGFAKILSAGTERPCSPNMA